MENPPKKFYRLSPGKEVRLRYGYFIKCVNVNKDPKTGKSSRFIVPTTRRREAGLLLMGGRSMRPSTGCPWPIPFLRRFACTIVCSGFANPMEEGLTLRSP